MIKSATSYGTISDFTTPEGYAFKKITYEGKRLISDKDRTDFVAALSADTSPEIRKLTDQFLSDLQSKSAVVAFGVVGDHIIFASGKNLEHLKFAPDAAQSLLTKPELAQLSPFMAKNLLGIAYADGAVLSALSDDQPVTPMLRGVVSAMKESDLFRSLANTLAGQIEEFSSLESKLYKVDCTAMSAAIWWEKGLHTERFGGPKPRQFVSGTPVQFAHLLDTPGVLFGMAFDRDKETEKAGRAWMEKLTGMIYTAAQELVKAGVAGKDGGQQFALFETNIRATVEKIYQADRDIADKALGGQCAYLIDMKGKLPALPNSPPAAKGTPIPRLYSVNEVIDRAKLAQSWAAISDAVPNGNTGNADSPSPAFALPDPISSDKNGVTTWFYGLPFLSGDLLPCASVNDKLLILSSSKDGAEALAAEVSKGAAQKVEGMIWKLDFDQISELMKSTVKLRAASDPKSGKDADPLKQTLRWLKPFHTMRSHTREENGVWRNTLTWDITDVLSFD